MRAINFPTLNCNGENKRLPDIFATGMNKANVWKPLGTDGTRWSCSAGKAISRTKCELSACLGLYGFVFHAFGFSVFTPALNEVFMVFGVVAFEKDHFTVAFVSQDMGGDTI